MILAESVLSAADDTARETDVVRLTWEERRKARQKLVTRAGRGVGLALRTGTVLHPGDVLYRDEALVIVVEGAPERVFVLSPTTTAHACLCCHQIGNLHRPIALDGPHILTPYEPVLEGQIARLGAPFQIEERVFTGEGLSATGGHVH